MEGPAQENQNNAGGGEAAAATAGGGGGGNAAAAAANAGQGNIDGSNIETSANENGNENDEEEAADSTVAPDASGPSSRYSLRKRKPPSLQGSNSIITATGNSNSNLNPNNPNSAVPAGAFGHGFVNGATLTDRQFEKLLAQYEDDGVQERAQKKLRLERGYGDDDYPYEPPAEGCPPLDSLPKECIQLLFELLPSVRAVFNLAYQSKHMLSFVEERSDIIVRAAVIGDALSSRSENVEKKALRVLIKEVRGRSIHVPSALRLLKLLCAKRCERGSNCWGYDLKTGLSSTEGVAAGCLPFGLALCKTCGKDVGHKFSYYNDVWRSWQDKGRICIHRWSRVISFDKAADVLTTSNGEHVGPIIEAKDITRIAKSHTEAAGKQEAYSQLLIECYGEEGNEERASYEQSCSELVNLFDEAEAELTSWLYNRQNEKREEAQAKHDEVLAKKKENIEPILAALETSVADLPLKDLALDFRHQDVSSEAVRFKYFFMRDTMGKLIKSPSTATPKKLAAALTEVKRKLTILSTSDDFFDLTFLSNAIDESSTPPEKRILQKMFDRARAYFPPTKSFLSTYQGPQEEYDRNKTNDRFFDLLEQKEYTTALLHVMEARGLLKSVVSSVLVSSTSSNGHNHRKLAQAAFLKVDKERPRGTDGALLEYTLSSFQSTLADVRREFLTLKTRARDYLNHQPVQDWVQGNEHQANLDYRRQEAVNNVWYPRASVLNRRSNNQFIPIGLLGVTPYRLLMDQDFDRLLRIHMFYYNWGGAHSNHINA